MTAAASAPLMLSPGWSALPREIAEEMSVSAGRQASNTIAALRQNLSRARASKKGNEAVGAIAASITWSEMLHTSYFEFEAVRDLIAAHVKSETDGKAGAPSSGVRWLVERPKASPPAWPQPFRPYLLSFAKVAIFGNRPLRRSSRPAGKHLLTLISVLTQETTKSMRLRKRAATRELVHRETDRLPEIAMLMTILDKVPGNRRREIYQVSRENIRSERSRRSSTTVGL